MSVCSHCSEKLPPENDFVVCGECNSRFHYTCSSVRETVWRKYSKDVKLSWKCAICKIKTVAADSEQSCVNDGDLVNGQATPNDSVRKGCKDLNPQKSINLSDEIDYLKQLLIHKDLIIEGQVDLINSLKAQIQLMTANTALETKVLKGNSANSQGHSAVSQGHSASPQGRSFKPGPPEVQSRLKTRNMHGIQCEAQPVKIDGPSSAPEGNSVQKSNYAIHEAHARAKMNEVINLAQDVDGTDWRTVKPKRYRNNRQVVIGERSDDGKCRLKASEALSYWHVYRLHPGTSTAEVEDYLKNDFPGVRVEELKSSNPTVYSSFKVTVREVDGPRILDAGLWPSGTRINRFFLPRNK